MGKVIDFNRYKAEKEKDYLEEFFNLDFGCNEEFKGYIEQQYRSYYKDNIYNQKYL